MSPFKLTAGRYLEDFWIYDLGTLQWTQAQATAAQQQGAGDGEGAPLLPAAALPPSAGHSVTTWGERLLVLGGHTKVGAVALVGAGRGRFVRSQAAARTRAQDVVGGGRG